MIRIFTLFLVIIVSVALLVWTRPDTQAELQSLPVTRVSTDVIHRMDLQPVIELTGKLQPTHKSTLKFEVSGKITQRLVEPGQKVKAGEPLVIIEAGDYQDSVDEAEALWLTEKKAIERDEQLLQLLSQERKLLEQEVNRLEKLGLESLSSKSKLDEAIRMLLQRQADESRLMHSVETGSARLKSKFSILNKARRNLERTVLKAPFDGTVNQITVENGDYVNSGQTAVEIVRLENLDLYLEVTGEVAQQLELGQEITIDINSETLTGNIIALSPDPDPDTHTHALRIRLSGEDIFPGQLAVAHLPGKILSGVTVVPVSAVLREEGRAFVFILDNNRIKRKPVVLSRRHEQWQVIQGVEAGIRIVDRDVSVLADGQEVIAE